MNVYNRLFPIGAVPSPRQPRVVAYPFTTRQPDVVAPQQVVKPIHLTFPSFVPPRPGPASLWAPNVPFLGESILSGSSFPDGSIIGLTLPQNAMVQIRGYDHAPREAQVVGPFALFENTNQPQPQYLTEGFTQWLVGARFLGRPTGVLVQTRLPSGRTGFARRLQNLGQGAWDGYLFVGSFSQPEQAGRAPAAW